MPSPKALCLSRNAFFPPLLQKTIDPNKLIRSFESVNVSWMLLKGRPIMIVGNVKPQKKSDFLLFLRTVDNQIMFSSSGLSKKYFCVHLPLCKKKTKNKSVAMQTFNIIYLTDALLHLLLQFWFSSSADATFCVSILRYLQIEDMWSWPTVRRSLNLQTVSCNVAEGSWSSTCCACTFILNSGGLLKNWPIHHLCCNILTVGLEWHYNSKRE